MSSIVSIQAILGSDYLRREGIGGALLDLDNALEQITDGKLVDELAKFSYNSDTTISPEALSFFTNLKAEARYIVEAQSLAFSNTAAKNLPLITATARIPSDAIPLAINLIALKKLLYAALAQLKAEQLNTQNDDGDSSNGDDENQEECDTSTILYGRHNGSKAITARIIIKHEHNLQIIQTILDAAISKIKNHYIANERLKAINLSLGLLLTLTSASVICYVVFATAIVSALSLYIYAATATVTVALVTTLAGYNASNKFDATISNVFSCTN